jgi:DNA polymerase III epsilon subunit-like protein
MLSYLDLPLHQAPLAFIDVETTGLDPGRGDKVVEVAVVRSQGLEQVATFTARTVQPLQVTGSYLKAYCFLRQAERTFRLDRIVEAQLGDPTH